MNYESDILGRIFGIHSTYIYTRKTATELFELGYDNVLTREVLELRGKERISSHGTMEPRALWGPGDPQVHGFESWPQSEGSLGIHSM